MKDNNSAPRARGLSFAGLGDGRPYVNPFLAASAQAPTKVSHWITEPEFAQMYAAAEFAAHWGLWLDVHVAIVWGLLGVPDDEEAVQAAFAGFVKCLRGWVEERRFPQAWIWAHERGPRRGLHTHLAVHVPHNVGFDLMWRKAFRAWISGWAKRTAGGEAPRAVRVRDAGGRLCKLSHWRNFNYLMKGVDRQTVVVSARNVVDGQEILLADLVAFSKAPGAMSMKRVGASRTLGQERRAVGMPPWAEAEHRSDEVVWLDLNAPVAPPRGRKRVSGSWTKPSWAGPDWAVGGFGPVYEVGPSTPRPPSFRSKYEDGARDVRMLYPPAFVEAMNLGYGEAARLRAEAEAAEALRAEQEAEAQEAEWLAQLRALDLLDDEE